MKKQKKLLVQIIVLLTILLSSCQVFAADYSSNFMVTKFSDEFLEYLELSDEEKANTLMPRTFDIPKTTAVVKNPLKLATMLRSSATSKYSLRDIIPENMVIKNQQSTNSCWTFASLAALESTLALKDYKNGNDAVVYDFSERHMQYATSQSFLENAVNENGFNRKIGFGNYQISIPYLTNGSGAIAETEMPFENNEDDIYITEIQDKKVLTQVNDTVVFPSYKSSDDKTEIIQQMKNHIKNYGAIDAGVHGASIDPDSSVYNNETGAIYCNSSTTHPANHAVAIIGWDDNYSTENFVASNKPTNNGAWIIKNSWGTGETYTLEEMKKYIFEMFPEEMADAGWTDATQIPDETAILNFESWGFTIENNVASLKIGDEGFMYVSYEDANIYLQMAGIVDAQLKEYENIYQYDQFGANAYFGYTTQKGYIANVFEKQTTGKEYLTQVAINAPETYTCKVYVNPNGTSKSWNDLQQVQLEAGESETFEAGYHTIEFLEPVKITGDTFVVVIEVQGTQSNSILISQEVNPKDYGMSSTIWDNVVVETGKSFVSFDENLADENWWDASTLDELSGGNAYNGDTTIKAFTTSQVLESIEITTPPTTTTYIEGENFDDTGMVVSAKYANGKTEVVTDYSIQDGTNLQPTQTSVTISYKGKTATQAITVRENIVETLSITAEPTKTEYYAGEDFDKTGLVIEATYTDGTTKKVTDYTIEDGDNLKNGQTAVTISYEGKTVTQAITVNDNPVVEIQVTKEPTKVNYVAGQNFDKTGMVVKATYENGMEKEVTDYTIKDGTNLKVGQTTVTIEYEGLTITQAITVVDKSITSITVKTMPAKTEYLQNKDELDLTGGVVEISYNDGTKEEILMTSEEIIAQGFSNKEVGTVTVTLTYKSKTAQFDVKIKAEERPENSNFTDVQGNVTKVRGYFFTDTTKTPYIILDLELSNIKKATVNDKMEYYYALSANQKETDIKNWVKIDNMKESNGQMSFDINTLNIDNFAEIADAENLYLYIKEIATRNDISQEMVTSAISLEMGNADVEIYNDGELFEIETPGTDSTPGEENDSTLAPEKIPNAGKSLLIIVLTFVVLIIGRITYLKYKDIQIK